MGPRPNSIETFHFLETRRSVIQVLILTGLLLRTGDSQAVDAKPDEERAAQVNRLIHQLDAPQLTERDAAERQLHALGPDVLPLLPAIDNRTSPEVTKRLSRLRQNLMRIQARSAAEPTLVTLHGEDLSLADVLAAISKQTGNPIEDHRAAFGQEAKPIHVTVDFDKTPYWKALDQVLDQAGLTLYGFGGKRGALVINRPPGAAPRAANACYAGMFRLEPVRFEAQRDLQNEKLGGLRLFVDVSWEPRLQPFSILQPLAEVSATGNHGEKIAAANPGANVETLIREGLSTAELELPFELPQRSTDTVQVLQGKLVALVPGPFEDFRFDELPLAQGAARAKPLELRKAGTTVTLEAVLPNNDVWEARLRLRFEAPPTALESHRGWVFDNQAFFEDAQGQQIEPGGLEQTLHSQDELGINYLFDLPHGPQGMTFVYRTPLVVLQWPVDYEFHDLRLP